MVDCILNANGKSQARKARKYILQDLNECLLPCPHFDNQLKDSIGELKTNTNKTDADKNFLSASLYEGHIRGH